MALITCAIITALMHESHIHIAMFAAVTVARVCDNLVVRTLGYAYLTAVLLLRPLILQQTSRCWQSLWEGQPTVHVDLISPWKQAKNVGK